MCSCLLLYRSSDVKPTIPNTEIKLKRFKSCSALAESPHRMRYHSVVLTHWWLPLVRVHSWSFQNILVRFRGRQPDQQLQPAFCFHQLSEADHRSKLHCVPLWIQEACKDTCSQEVYRLVGFRPLQDLIAKSPKIALTWQIFPIPSNNVKLTW